LDQVKKRSGETETFDEAKLETSLTKAGAKKEHAAKITEMVARIFREGMETTQIKERAATELSKTDPAAAHRYQTFTKPTN